MSIAKMQHIEEEPTPADRIVDAARHVAHVSHEARLMKSMAEDAIEDGMHAAKRAMKSVRRGVETLQDLKEEAAHTVKRRPFAAVAAALGTGILLGAGAAWIGARLAKRQP